MFILYFVLIFSLSLCSMLCYSVNLLGIKAAQNKQRKGHFLKIFVWFKKKHKFFTSIEESNFSILSRENMNLLELFYQKIHLFISGFDRSPRCHNFFCMSFPKSFKILPTRCNYFGVWGNSRQILNGFQGEEGWSHALQGLVKKIERF